MHKIVIKRAGMKFDMLVRQIRDIDKHARRDTTRAVNVSLTLPNWSIGHYELKGEDARGSATSCSTACPNDFVGWVSRVAIGGSSTAILTSVRPTHRLWGRCPHNSLR